MVELRRTSSGGFAVIDWRWWRCGGFSDYERVAGGNVVGDVEGVDDERVAVVQNREAIRVTQTAQCWEARARGEEREASSAKLE